MNDFVLYDDVRFWNGVEVEFRRRQSSLTELRRSNVVVTYTRLGDPEKLLLPKMNIDQTIGLAFLARYLYEHDEDLAVFAMGVLEAIKLMVFKKYQLKERVVEEDSIFWLLIDLQHFFVFEDDEPHWKHFIANNYANYAPLAPKKPSMFFGNLLRDAFRHLFQISLIGESKPRKPQRRKGYNDKGSTRPQSAWKPKSDFSLDDDQNYTYQMRAMLDIAFDLSLNYVYSDVKDWILRRGRSIFSLFSELNFKNYEREDDLYVSRKQKYPRKSKSGSKSTGKIREQTFSDVREYQAPKRKIDKVRDPDFTDGIAREKFRVPDLRNLKKTVEERAIVEVKEYDGSGAQLRHVNTFWNTRFLKNHSELSRSKDYENFLVYNGIFNDVG